MVKFRNSVTAKVAAFFLAVAIVFCGLPTGFMNAFASSEKKFGTFSAITEGGSVTDAATEFAVASYGNVTLKWDMADPVAGRPVDGWWIGVKMTAPADMTTAEDFDGVYYRRCTSMKTDPWEWSDKVSFWNSQDSDKNAESAERYLTMWGIVNEQYLNDALLNNKKLNFAWSFDWDKDGVYEQTAKLEIDPSNIVLMKEGVQVYPSTSGMATVTPFSDGLTVQGDASGNFVKVKYSADAVLDFIKADATIGRVYDGWWAGVKVAAPESLKTEADFENVKYQSYSSTGWGTAKDFWKYKDSKSDPHFIGLWGMITKEYLEKVTTTMSYIWRFDWNKDGVYEQLVVLEIDPSYITLNDQSGVQIYPDLGDVSALTEGNFEITGNKTGNVVLNASDIALDWHPKDESIGRYTDGWWTGIQITAPESLELTQSNDVFFQLKSGDAEWSDNKSFYTYQDSDPNNSSSNFMQMWGLLNGEKKAAALESNNMITTQWRFDWNRDGEFEQVVSLNIDPKTLTLKQLDRTDFTFENTDETINVWVGDGKFVNEAYSENAPGDVTYEIIEGAEFAELNPQKPGEVVFKGCGEVVVKATIAENDVYKEATKEYTLIIEKAQPEGLRFQNSSPADMIYSEGATFENPATIAKPMDGKIVYSITQHTDLDGNTLTEDAVATIDEATGKLTILRSGKVTVNAVFEEDDNYYRAEADSYTLTIKKAEQTGFGFVVGTPETLTYSETPYEMFIVEGGQVEKSEITYEIIDGDKEIAELTEDGKICTLKAGTFTLRATKAGNDCYNSVYTDREIIVSLAPQNDFAFEYSAPEAITWNQNKNNEFKNVAIGGKGTGAVTYEIVEGADVAEFADAQKPATIKFTKAGTVTVKATIAADEQYDTKTITYTIEMKKADQQIVFASADEITVYYGTTSFTNAAQLVKFADKADGIGHGAFAPVYTLVGKSNIGAKIDANTGEITFSDSKGKVGEITIKVENPEDDRYNSCEATYTLKVVYLEIPENAYSFDRQPNENGWYNKNVDIIATADYAIAYDNELSTEFKDKVSYFKQGTSSPVVYLKNADGYMTDAIQVSELKMDSSVPEVLDVSYTAEVFDYLKGYYYDRLCIKLSFKAFDEAENEESGVDYVLYSTDGGITYEKVMLDEKGEGFADIYAQYRGALTYRLVDKAGNMSGIDNEFDDKSVLVIDEVDPKLTVGYDYSDFYRKNGEIIYTKDDVTINFELKADNVDLAKVNKIFVNEVEQNVEWNHNGLIHKASVTLADTDYYQVTFNYLDNLNRTQEYFQEIHVDKDIPEFSEFVFAPGEVKNTKVDRKYYDEKQTVEIIITDDNFDSELIDVKVTADNTAVDTEKYKTDYKRPENWERIGDSNQWKAILEFTQDANYSLTVEAEDLAGNTATSETCEFTVDTDSPAKPQVSVDKPALAKVLETITFGFFDAPLTVTATSSDATSGVKKMEWTYVGTKSEYDKTEVNLGGEIETDDDKIVFTLPEEARNSKGTLTVVAYDWSTNSSAQQNITNDATGDEVGGFVLDDIAPTRTVGVSKAQRVVDAKTLTDIKNFDYNTENQNAILYYNDKTTVTFTVKEANFYAEDVVIKVNGARIYLNNWNLNKNNEWVGSFDLVEEGDYVVTMNYTDKNGNVMDAYTSEKIVVDRTLPEIFVDYDNENIIQTIDGRDYLDSTQRAVITVRERNFRADDFRLNVYAKDVADKNIVSDTLTFNKDGIVNEYFNDGCNRAKWATCDEADTYQLIVEYNDDANYSFDAEYTDLATNADKSDVARKFTVDTTTAYELNIEYSKPVFDQVLNKLTFGYYNSDATVTISAKDDVASIEYFNITVKKDGLAEATKLELPKDLVLKADGSVMSGTKGFIGDVTATEKDGKVALTFKVPAQFRGEFVIDSVTDLSHNTTGEYDDKDVVVVDTISPDVKVEFTGPLKDKVDVDKKDTKPTRQPKKTADAETRYIYNGEITATITVKEANFYDDMVITVYRDGEAVKDSVISDWKQINGTYEYVKTITMSADGDYQIKLDYKDKSSNNMDIDATGEYAQNKADKVGTYTSNIHSIDTIEPEYTITYDNNKVIQTNEEGREYFDAKRTATIKVIDRNFRPNEVEFKVVAKDIKGADVKAYTYSKLVSLKDWDYEDGVWTAVVPFAKDANYTVDFTYADIAGNAVKSDYNALFTVDTTDAYDLNVEYSKNIVDEILSSIFFYNTNATVTISAKDDMGGIEYFSIDVKSDGLGEATDLQLPKALIVNADGSVRSGSKGFIGDITATEKDGKVTLSFEVPAQFRGEFVIKSVADMSRNESATYDDNRFVVVDTVSPDVKIEFAGALEDKIDADGKDSITRQTKDTADSDTRYVYSSAVTATITVQEANFYDDMVITVYRDGEVVKDSVISDWAQVDGTFEYVKTVELMKDGDYQIKLEYADKSDNQMDIDATGEYAENKADKVGTYISNIHTIDTTTPVFEIAYDNNEVISTVGSREYFDADRTATIKVTDRNFRPNEVEFVVAAKDVTDKDVSAYSYSKLVSWNDWKQDGITWTATVPFTTDANYTVDFTYTDIAGHKIEADYNTLFTVDKVAPQNLTVKYLEPTFVERIIEAVTFNFYNAPVKAEISATDDISGVNRFIYSYVKSQGVSDVNAELLDVAVSNAEISYSGNKASATFTIPAEALTEANQFRGNVEFTAYDICENNDDTKDPIVVVVDNIAPEIEVTYTAKSEDTEVRYIDKDVKDVEDFESATQAIYNGNVTAKIAVNEANFFEGKEFTENDETGVVHEVGLLLTKTDNNGVVTKTEYLPAGSAQMFASETANRENVEWTHDKDLHTFEIEYDADADYVLTVKYVDLSTNEAEIEANDGNVAVRLYESKKITIDKINPVISVEYSNTDVKNTIDGREYFDKYQTATITVTEHNFRADDVAAKITAKDVIGGNVEVTDFAALLRNRNSWIHYDENGNLVENVEDGNVHVATINYTDDANYTFDIAYTDLANRESKDYAEDLFTVDKTAPTKLTVSYDEPKLWDKILQSITFGFYNAKMKVTITADDSTSGIYHFRYSYIKSKGVSNVNAELIDQAIREASIEHKGATSIAYFSIPKLVLNNDNQFNGTVEFTAYDRAENSTDKADEKRIVVDNIKPTSRVEFSQPVRNENNISYYAGNIDATVVINEANFYSSDVVVSVTRDGANYPVQVNWTDNNVDVHTGTFTLTDEGDYIVTVNYTDRSTNQMDTYESNRLTIDRTHPTVSVSNIKNNSANKDEVYTFTITAADTNIDMNSIKPVLRAVLRDEKGNYSVQEISLGNLRTIDAGKSYSYTIENLEEDAVYTLTCTLSDMSGNSYARIRLDDGNEYDSVDFSINREGSTFKVDADTAKMLEQYYVFSVDKDVVIEETNVDPVENYTVKLNGEVLTEGKDFTTTLSNKADEWSKRTYIIKKSLFKNEGEYNIIVESVDKTETTAFSDVKNLKVAFVVDQTAPVLTISGLADGGRYQVEEQTITVIPTDDGGMLRSFKAILLDSSGKELDVRFEMAGEELLTYLEEHDGKITFTIPEGFESQVRIICNDCAADSEGAANAFDQTFKRVTVSPSGWVIFYANKPLFYGSIAGVVLLIGGIVFLIILKNRKKNDNKKNDK